MTGVHASSTHYPALDGIRGIAVLGVLVLHGVLVPVATKADAWVAAIANLGFTGVDIFFVLSGFLITGILIDAKGAPNYFRNFYARRSLRIFPLYFVTLILLLALAPGADGERLRELQGWHWAYLVNIPVAIYGWTELPLTAHWWSLAVEEQFYLVWPIMVWALSRERFRRFAWCVVVGASAIRIGLFLAHWLGMIDPHFIMANYVLTPMRADGLAVGGLIALSLREPGGAQRLRRLVQPLAIVSALGITGLWIRHGEYNSIGRDFQVIGYPCVAAGAAALLIAAITGPDGSRLRRTLEGRWLRFFGKYSYAMYVIHPIVGYVLYEAFPPAPVAGSGIVAGVARFVVLVACTVPPAVLSWVALERPMLSLKRFFEPKPDDQHLAVRGGMASQAL